MDRFVTGRLAGDEVQQGTLVFVLRAADLLVLLPIPHLRCGLDLPSRCDIRCRLSQAHATVVLDVSIGRWLSPRNEPFPRFGVDERRPSPAP